MNQTIKPFRIINPEECHRLQEDFARRLQHWNKEYALFPLSLQLRVNPKPASLAGHYCLVDGQNRPVALIDPDRCALSHCLFGQVSPCFDNISRSQLLILLHQLTESSSLQESGRLDPQACHEWFYTGAPSLGLTLMVANYDLNLYLHPEWTRRLLPRPKSGPRPKSRLLDALAQQPFDCNVELDAVSLPLKTLLDLRVGDVIKTDHPLEAPLLLTHQHQTVCRGGIGKTNDFKSIQIASS